MARSDGSEDEIWGTWEELLLACAVSRHGKAEWTSVAMEIQSRTSTPRLLTPQSCKQRYNDLCRRFEGAERRKDDGAAGDVAAAAADDCIPWLEELRRLRVAELRREVERYDVTIMSLQRKVKRLKEAKERETSADEVADDVSPREAENEVVVGPSDRPPLEDDSFEPAALEGKQREEAVKANPLTTREDKASAAEGSSDGSSDSVAKAAVAESAPAEEDPRRVSDEARNSGESVTESKGEASKEATSDVHSSGSLSRKKRGGRRKAAASTSSSGGGESPVGEEWPARSSDCDAKSQPLVAVLEIIQSLPYGSVFERRLDAQESTEYKAMIRQHVDLDTVWRKLEDGAYRSPLSFFRDLLLLCSNATVFFPRDSPESTAAAQLRALINQEISTALSRSNHSPKPESPPPAQPPPKLLSPKLELQVDGMPGVSVPLSACKKRSSALAKEAAVKEENEEERDDGEDKEKVGLEKELVNVNKKKEPSERSVAARGLRTTKARAAQMKPTSSNTATIATATSSTIKSDVKDDMAESPKTADKDDPGVSVSKKRSAAGFLNRLKRSAPRPSTSSNDGNLLQTPKSSEGGGNGADQKVLKGDVNRKEQGPRQAASKQADQKKVVVNGDVNRKEQGPRQAASKQEDSVPIKRGVGRPPKRPPPSNLPTKRTREDASSPPPPPRAVAKKRGRR